MKFKSFLTGASCLSLFLMLILPAVIDLEVDAASQNVGLEQDFIPGEVIVKLKDTAKKQVSLGSNLTIQAEKASNDLQLPFVKLKIQDIESVLGAQSLNQIKFSKQKTLEIIKNLRLNPNVEYAEPNYILKASYTANDPYYTAGKLWGLNNTGQDGGTDDKDINAPEAWNIVESAPGVKVAVLDSGVDYTHEDLAGNIDLINGSNPVTPGNINGYNFCANESCSGVGNNNPQDFYGHGTHIAGIIAAVGKNNKGVIGACPNCKIMPIKVINTAGAGTITSVTSGIYYAIDHGAKVINLSIGAGGIYSQSLHTALEQARNENIIVVAAGGNCGNSSFAVNGCSYQNEPVYPASDPNVIAVGSIDRNGQKSSFSNANSYVALTAPGSSVLSTFPPGVNESSGCGDSNFGSANDGYGYCSGTSMSVPYVAGVAGLFLSKYPDAKPSQFIQAATHTAKDIYSSGKDNNSGYGIANAGSIVDSLQEISSSKAYSIVKTKIGVSLFYIGLDGNLYVQQPDAVSTWSNPIRIGSDTNINSLSVITDGSWINIYYNTSDNKILHRYSNNGTQWSNSDQIPNITTNKPFQAFLRSGVYSIAFVGTDGNMYYQYFFNNTWSNPIRIGSDTNINSLSVITDGSWINIYYNTSDNKILHRYSNNGTQWSNSDQIPNITTNKPFQAFLRSGVYSIAFVGTDGNMYYQYYSGGWSIPSSVLISSEVENFAIFVEDNWLNVYYSFSDNKILHRYSNNGTQWSNSDQIPNITTNKPFQAFLRSGVYSIAFVGTDGNMYYQYFFNNTWSNPIRIGSDTNINSLSVITDGSWINIYYNTSDNKILHRYSNNGTQWSNSDQIPNITTNKPFQAFLRSGVYSIAFVGTDGNMYYQYFFNNTWSNPIRIGSDTNINSLSVITDGSWINIYYNTSDNKILHRYSNNGTQWSNSDQIPNITTNKPFQAFLRSGVYSIAFVGTDGNMYYQYYSGGWSNTFGIGLELNTDLENTISLSIITDGAWINVYFNTTNQALKQTYTQKPSMDWLSNGKLKYFGLGV